jgi:hypothetical protein
LPTGLGEGQHRDDFAYKLLAFLARDLHIPDDRALYWAGQWDIQNNPPKGPERLREILANVHQYGQRAYGSGLGGTPSRNGTQTGGSNPKDDPRPQILLTTEEHYVNEQAARALANEPTIFQRGNILVRVVREPKQEKWIERDPVMPRIIEVVPAILSERLTAVARFMGYKAVRNGKLKKVPKHPPDRLLAAVLARGEWNGIRPLEGVVDSPVLRPDGSILQTPGYDAMTGLLLEPNITLPPIPHSLSKEDITRACDILLEVVADFPFAKVADVKQLNEAVWIAALLTPLARYAFRGPAPMFAIDANVRGSGKGLLVSATSTIVCGRAASVMSATQDDNEFRKRITAISIAGDQLVNIDNINGAIGCPSLEAVLTCSVWKDRLLGTNQLAEVPIRTTWFCTGNNIVFTGDLSRRVCRIRLESKEEHPEERKGFQHPDLLQWVRAERRRFLHAALTILKGYCDGGRPDQNLTPWGSYESWSDLVRSAVVWAGLADPGKTRQEVRARSDKESLLPALLDGLEYLNQKYRERGGLRASQIVKVLHDGNGNLDGKELALRELIMQLFPLKVSSDFPSAVAIGKKLQGFEGRVCGGKYLKSADPNKCGILLWSVERVDCHRG